jgi:glutamate---cysteine ligase / carboxylate-amine ligase
LRTVGVEEELFLLDPASRRTAPRAPQVLDGADDALTEDGQLAAELYRHQVETRTSPHTSLDDLRAELVAARADAAEAAGRDGLAVVASGTVPTGDEDAPVTRDDRYLAMREQYGEVARAGRTCGMHVHVGVDSDEEGVAVVDAVTPWLPLVLAVSGNSPYHQGRDTAYASWRSQQWSRWPSAGATERFGSLERYREVTALMVASGAARDEKMLYLDARLSAAHPTVEVRVADVCTDPDDAVLVAALLRALVSSYDALPAVHPVADRAELRRAATWRAARYGVTERLLDPVTAELAPAAEVLDRLVGAVDLGPDDELVRGGVTRVLRGGGASRQRAAYERGQSLESVVDDLVARTAQG